MRGDARAGAESEALGSRAQPRAAAPDDVLAGYQPITAWWMWATPLPDGDGDDGDDDSAGLGDVVDGDALAVGEVVGPGERLLCGVADGLAVRVGLDAYGVALDV